MMDLGESRKVIEISCPTFIRRWICKFKGHRYTHMRKRSLHIGEVVGVEYEYWCGICGNWFLGRGTKFM